MALRVTVLTGIFPPDIGGPATSVPELVRFLKQNERNVTLVTLADGAGRNEADPCLVVRIPRRLHPLRRTREIVRAVERTRPDIVFANGLHVESALVLGVPVVQKI